MLLIKFHLIFLICRAKGSTRSGMTCALSMFDKKKEILAENPSLVKLNVHAIYDESNRLNCTVQLH